ncbi:kinase-like domain-containing protein [Gigaspora rosea]|uniref:Kinase-like domain-containing protein n=1 Tax=Gigaspora rosea TaxID=44941 RepID=A0A397UMC5_9GLOM|nr:kinase-like domain-containing protein [Gigaspora rosea]
MGKYEESLADLNKLLNIEPTNANALNNCGEVYQMIGEYEKSLIEFNKLLAIYSNDKIALYNRGLCYLQMGRYEESLADLNKVLSIDPNHVKALNNRGEVYRVMGRYDDALADLNKSLEIEPCYETALNNRALCYNDMGKHEKALIDLNKSLEIEPKSANALYNRGIINQVMGRYEESLTDLNKSLEIEPNNELTMISRVETYRKMGRNEDSLAECNRLLELDPNNPEALNNRGLLYLEIGKYEESLADFDKSLEIKANFAETLINRGSAYRIMGRYEESLADLNKSLESDSNNVNLLIQRGETYRMMGRIEESLSELNRILKINPNDSTALNNRGLIYQVTNRYEESLAEFNISLEIDPNIAETWNNRGRTYQELNNYEESLVDLNKSLEINPNNVRALVDRGLTYQLMGKYKESIADLNSALEIKLHRKCKTARIKFGTCPNCKQYNTGFQFCHSCDVQINQDWTSGNNEIDNFIREAQKESEYHNKIIEWIPFDRLENIKKIGEGGFGTVYSANWIDGKRIYSQITNNPTPSRETSCTVAVKALHVSQNMTMDFFEEFKAYYECQIRKFSIERFGIETYGITYNPIEKQYMMVIEYADEGNLRQYLERNFRFLTWKQKIKFLRSISDNLSYIHQNYIHRDFHSGNILMFNTDDFVPRFFDVGDKIIMLPDKTGGKLSVEPKISDLGLSIKVDKHNVVTYGVISYLAPEVLLQEPYTKASDIYSFGVVMSEMSTGNPPFKNRLHNKILIQEIINGLRPEFDSNTPDCYIELANQCTNKDPVKRPTVEEVYEKLQDWEIILDKSPEKLNEKQREIANAFSEADKNFPTLSTSLHNQNSKYTSQFIGEFKIIFYLLFVI